MRLKTMNKKINQVRLDMSMVLGEFKLKLDTYLKNNTNINCYSEVNCNSVCIYSDDFLPDDVIENVQWDFFLKLNSYQQTFTKNDDIIEVLYVFHHTKPS